MQGIFVHQFIVVTSINLLLCMLLWGAGRNCQHAISLSAIKWH